MTGPLDKVREAVPHAILETLFGHSVAELVGGFAGNVVANIIAGAILAAAGAALAWFGFRELPAILKARTIRKGDPNRLNILIAKIEGDGGRDIRDHILAQLNIVFGDIGRWPFAVHEFPLSLREAEAGLLSANNIRLEKKGRKWLRRASGDLLIWGRSHGWAKSAKILFLLPLDGGHAGYVRGRMETKGLHIYDFGDSAETFGNDAARAIGLAALMSVRPIFDSDEVQKIKPVYARELIEKLDPFVRNAPHGIPINLLTEIRQAYRTASEGLGRMGLIEGWKQAFDVLKRQLAATDRDADPDRWSNVGSALAQAYSEAGAQFGDRDLIDSAISTYRDMQSAFAREHTNSRWTAIQSNLGEAHKIIGRHECGTQHLDEAVVAFREASESWRAVGSPLWITGYCNLAVSLSLLFQRTGASTKLEEALQLSGEIATQDNLPPVRILGEFHFELGAALDAQGSSRDVVEQHLEAALNAYKKAIQTTDTRDTLGLIKVNLGLGRSLLCRGKRETSSNNVEKALDIFRSMTKFTAREQYPIQWALLQLSFADALVKIGQRTYASDDVFEEAISRYRDALEILTPDKVPYNCAVAQIELAWVLAERGRNSDSVNLIEEAIDLCESTRRLLDPAIAPKTWVHLQNVLGASKLYLAYISLDLEMAESSVKVFQSALTASSGAVSSQFLSAIQGNLGNALQFIGKSSCQEDKLYLAINAYEHALEAFSVAGNPDAWMLFKNNLGCALSSLGEVSGESAHIKRAIGVFREVLSVAEGSDNEHLIQAIRSDLHEAESKLQ